MASTIAVIISALGLVGTAILMTWRMVRAATLLESTIAGQKVETSAIRLKLDILDRIPVIENDLGNLKIEVHRYRSVFPEIKNKIAVIETRLDHYDTTRPSKRRIDE